MKLGGTWAPDPSVRGSSLLVTPHPKRCNHLRYMIFSCLTNPGGLPIDSYQVSPQQIPCSHITRPVNHGHWTPFRCYVKPVFLCVSCLMGYLHTSEQPKHNIYHKYYALFFFKKPHIILSQSHQQSSSK